MSARKRGTLRPMKVSSLEIQPGTEAIVAAWAGPKPIFRRGEIQLKAQEGHAGMGRDVLEVGLLRPRGGAGVRQVGLQLPQGLRMTGVGADEIGGVRNEIE